MNQKEITCAVYKITFADGYWYVGATTRPQAVLNKSYRSSHKPTKEKTYTTEYSVDLPFTFTAEDKGVYDCDMTACAHAEFNLHKQLLEEAPDLSMSPSLRFDNRFNRKSRETLLKTISDPEWRIPNAMAVSASNLDPARNKHRKDQTSRANKDPVKSRKRKESIIKRWKTEHPTTILYDIYAYGQCWTKGIKNPKAIMLFVSKYLGRDCWERREFTKVKSS